jgi:MOSC domain-containing protein YiiM
MTASRKMQAMEGEIIAIWIKKAHRLPLDAVTEAELVAERGIVGNAHQGGWRQITIIDEEAWLDAQAELGKDVDPSRRRANVMIRGIDLEKSRGRRLRLGECVIDIRGENPPCRQMGDMQKPLKPHWRAGVFGSIEKGGTIRVGDAVTYQL